MSCVVSCAAALVLGLSTTVLGAPQDPTGIPLTSLEQIRDRLQKPPEPRLMPSEPAQLWPTFKSEVERHPWVPTLEQELHKQFDLNAFQRQSAEWRSKCCGINLGQVYNAIGKALDERRVTTIRAQIRRELAELEASRAAAILVK